MNERSKKTLCVNILCLLCVNSQCTTFIHFHALSRPNYAQCQSIRFPKVIVYCVILSTYTNNNTYTYIYSHEVSILCSKPLYYYIQTLNSFTQQRTHTSISDTQNIPVYEQINPHCSFLGHLLPFPV